MKLIVLGSGPGGYVAAIKAAQRGARVTVIEEHEVGGTCLNWGCIPTKALVASAELLSRVREMDKFGIELSGEVVPNLTKIMARKDRIVSTQIKGIRGLFNSWDISLAQGRGVVRSPREIEVTSRDGDRQIVEADKIIIATGSRPAEIPSIPFDGNYIISSSDALALQEIPKSLIILGAGVIGCEFACIFRELGTEVTMVEMLPRAVATEDREISELLEKEFRKKKIRLITGTKMEKVEVRNGEVHASLSGGDGLVAEKLLVSVGRTLNSDRIGLEAAGIETGPRGEIRVNERMETNVAGVYAVGDVSGGILLAHTASREGIIASLNSMGGDEVMDYRVVPSVIFSSPEIASVGLREHQAEEQGVAVRTGSFQFRALGKAHAIGEISGFVKVVADASTDSVLGVHIIGPHASDLIHEAALAMKAGLRVKDIAGTIHAHPTLSEGLMEAAEDVHGDAIHVPKK